MPIDHHATSVITPFTSGLSSFTLSVWRTSRAVAIATTAGCRRDCHDCCRSLRIVIANTSDVPKMNWRWECLR
ncbi:hypothetical protein Y032_0025g1222 [Ancylostoma ceylanicum]|uniref:Uncharacterized protein n=1 Tax=Ancylostoma ceylanicum TaxID=53326 RepID=A0A016UVH3_9BILA|nr:hypothetical protein Y032_0025g1222 [Ancylostoma ceylanicum]